MTRYKKLVCLLLFIGTTNSYAFSWRDLWQTQNHQAQLMMQAGDYEGAKKTFTNKDWQATALFRSKDYSAAASIYAKSKSKHSSYNYGNALAFSGKLEQAIAAYNKALVENPEDKDAAYNRKIVEEMLKKQKKEEQQKNKDQKDPSEDQDKNSNQDNQGTKQDKENKNDDKKSQNNDNKKEEDKNQAGQKKPEKPQPEKQDSPKPEQEKDLSEHDKQQMKDQWLRLIPDDPGGLLREKFRRDYLRRKSE
ncbi:MAG: tetratricopeptide repeat protein [Legionellaceae bacterium]|nr:tetratricopeptide repeat protein [Legionellaceae bacterium]